MRSTAVDVGQLDARRLFASPQRDRRMSLVGFATSVILEELPR